MQKTVSPPPSSLNTITCEMFLKQLTYFYNCTQVTIIAYKSLSFYLNTRWNHFRAFSFVQVSPISSSRVFECTIQCYWFLLVEWSEWWRIKKKTYKCVSTSFLRNWPNKIVQKWSQKSVGKSVCHKYWHFWQYSTVRYLPFITAKRYRNVLSHFSKAGIIPFKIKA